MRALRDFNLPKIIADDFSIFTGLISDLFPSLEVPRSRDQNLEKAIKEAACDLKLQPEESFILKIVQLHELFDVRHSVFIIGDAGSGKSQTWKTLFRTYQNLKMKPMFTDLNPKAVTNDELYGVINPSSREWQDGLFSSIMRSVQDVLFQIIFENFRICINFDRFIQYKQERKFVNRIERVTAQFVAGTRPTAAARAPSGSCWTATSTRAGSRASTQ